MMGVHRRRRALLFVSCAALAATTLPGYQVFAATVAETAYKIPAEPLSQALKDYGKASRRQLIFSPDLVRGKIATPVSGSYPADSALSQLLRGTGLTSQSLPSGAVMIVKTPETISDASRNVPQAEAGQEIVVTAQKVKERLQDVPLTVNTVSGSSLENSGAKHLTDFAATIPGFQVTTTYGNPGEVTLTIRGISTGSTNSTTVSTYIDDIPLSSSSAYNSGGFIGIDMMPYDLSRVEVLKGPQGTLYGASSLGGLLKYVTKDPNLNQFFVNAGGEAFGIDHSSGTGQELRGSANLPILPGELALSVSGAHSYTPGYVDDVATGAHDYNRGTENFMRAELLWKPIDKFTARLGAIYSSSNYVGQGTIAAVTATQTPIYGYYDAYAFEPQGDKATLNLYSLNLNYDLGFAALTSITGFSRSTNDTAIDASVTYQSKYGVLAPFDSEYDLDKFTQEVRLASPENDRFHWLIGGFYTNEAALYQQLGLGLSPTTGLPVAGKSPLNKVFRPSNFNERAVFADATYNITPKWDLSAGIRYSQNDQTVSQASSGLLQGTGPQPVYKPTSDNPVTYSVSTRYHFTPDMMIYARIATGYRPGGANNANLNIPATFGADTLTNYEAGFKSEWLNRKFLFDVTLFYLDWRDIQINQVTATNLSYTGNGGRAKSQGVEFVTSYRITPEFKVGVSGTYTDASLTTAAPALKGVSGDPLPNSPGLAGDFTADYSHDFGRDYLGSVGLNWRYVGGFNTSFPLNASNFHLAPYNAADITASLMHDRVRYGLYVRNVGNSNAYLTSGALGPVIMQPRTIGFSIDKSF